MSVKKDTKILAKFFKKDGWRYEFDEENGLLATSRRSARSSTTLATRSATPSVWQRWRTRSRSKKALTRPVLDFPLRRIERKKT